MRVIAIKTLKQFWEEHPLAEQPLKTWYEDAKDADWNSPQELKQLYRHASIISGKRVVFNIKGNEFRLIADIEYALGIIFIAWIGTHKEYDRINAKTVKYEKTDKNRKGK